MHKNLIRPIAHETASLLLNWFIFNKEFHPTQNQQKISNEKLICLVDKVYSSKFLVYRNFMPFVFLVSHETTTKKEGEI